jgi:hypothetical protein
MRRREFIGLVAGAVALSANASSGACLWRCGRIGVSALAENDGNKAALAVIRQEM